MGKIVKTTKPTLRIEVEYEVNDFRNFSEMTKEILDIIDQLRGSGSVTKAEICNLPDPIDLS